jgi:hypothetical protein
MKTYQLMRNSTIFGPTYPEESGAIAAARACFDSSDTHTPIYVVSIIACVSANLVTNVTRWDE